MCLAPIRAKIVQVIGLVLESTGLSASLGEICAVYDGLKQVGQAEVVGFRRKTTLLMALGQLHGLKPGMEVMATGQVFSVRVGPQLLGRVLNGLGEPIDGKGPMLLPLQGRVNNDPPNPLDRRRISEPMITGIRAIDGFRTVGKGQRVGLFAGSGVGKSVLLGMIARNCKAQVNVIALIGERGREVKEFLEKDLGAEGLSRSVVVVATSDQPALIRLKAAMVATAIAEYFRDLGSDVMLMMDSSTRLAMAQREIGLAIGEPPSTRGYTPSVFAMLPRLMERAGMGKTGSITALYTVLVEGDDMDEPVADAVRSVLDGHIVLSRSLAHRNHYPAIDVLRSVSRCMSDVTSKEHRAATGKLLNAMAVYADAEDMVNLGAYVRGSNPQLDMAIAIHAEVDRFLIQGVEDKSELKTTLDKVAAMAGAIK
ncbi:MAG: flagellar protein export ATPase FliI [Fibrobacteres bacterium]|nr:flagellar protein export ATPase FliI [Fibrobacterota bacterium]